MIYFWYIENISTKSCLDIFYRTQATQFQYFLLRFEVNPDNGVICSEPETNVEEGGMLRRGARGRLSNHAMVSAHNTVLTIEK